MPQMVQEEFTEGDLLYHSVHGVCRMDRKIEQTQSGKKVRCYSLTPKALNNMKVRFIIGVKDIEVSGFHTIVSPKEANQILDYLKERDNTDVSVKNETWTLAKTILDLSREKADARDQRKRQMLERSVKGLLGELAFVLKITLKETATRIQKSLGSPSKINPLVIGALANAAED